MTFLPIVARELRVTARRASTYWVRFAAAALALVICGWSFMFLNSMGAANMAGQMLFGGATGLAWLYAVIGGIFKTADSLSEEKREGTLGLLFLTDLKGYDIVLGKIVAASVNWFFGLIAIFPILALALLMGGVAPGEFWRKILGLTNLLFYSLALGMFVSSFSRNERRSAGLTIMLLFTLLYVPSEFAEWYKKSTGALELSPWFVLPDVTRPLHYSEDYLAGRNPGFYWGSLGVSHAVGWFYLLLASVIVPRTWQQQAGKMSRAQEWAEQFTYGKNAARRKRFRERALELNPFYWIAARARGQSVMLLLVLIGVCACFLISFLRHPNTGDGPWAYFWTAFLLHGIIKVWLALAAGRRFVEDRRSGALELILSTPLTPEEIIRGQWSALLRQFRGPILFVLCVDALLLFRGWESISNKPVGKDQLLYLLLWGAGLFSFFADAVGLGWLAMWRGLKARHSYTVWLWCVVQLLVLPWVIFYVGVTVGFMLIVIPQAMQGGATTAATSATLTKWMDWMPHLCVALWLNISLVAAIFSAWWARRCLKKYFRYQATLSYQPVKASWSPRAKPATVPPPLTPR